MFQVAHFIDKSTAINNVQSILATNIYNFLSQIIFNEPSQIANKILDDA